MPRVVRSVPVSAFDGTLAFGRFQERVVSLVRAYRAGAHVPPIPVRVGRAGPLRLLSDGNHRLAAAREAGIATVSVDVDEREAGALDELLSRLSRR